jgi:hypothetical protein
LTGNIIAAGLTDGPSSKMSGKWDHGPAKSLVEPNLHDAIHLMKENI